MAAATSTVTHGTPSRVTSGKAPVMAEPVFDFPANIQVDVELNETWLQQLQEEHRQRLEGQAQLLLQKHLVELEAEGPFVTQNKRAELQQRYDEQLERIKQRQQDEVDQHIEMERQERLWSLGEADPTWEGWERIYQQQELILSRIKRDIARSREIGCALDAGKSVEDMIMENEREDEDLRRVDQDWRRTEYQRVQDRQMWSERVQSTNHNIGERRQRDMAEAYARRADDQAKEEQSTRLGAEAREGAAQLRTGASRAAFNTEYEAARQAGLPSLSETSSRASMTDSLFGGSPTFDTPASSVYGGEQQQRWQPDGTTPRLSTRSTPSPTSPVFGTGLGSGSGSSPQSRSRPTGMPSPSPLSGAPTSNTTGYPKGDEQNRPTVWIPPEGTREPTHKKSTIFEGTRQREPARKESMLFGASPSPPPPPVLEDPPRRHQAHQAHQPPQPQSQPGMRPRGQSQAQQARTSQSPQSPFHPPNAPATRSQPLPQSHPQSHSHSRPTTAYSSQPPPVTRGSAAPRPTPVPTPSNTGHRAASSPMNMGAKPSPSPMKTGPKPTPSPPTSSDERRSELRNQYVSGQEQRAEDERKRREEEANERRAAEARRRGAEKRRMEEQAREADRREAERKARASGKPTPTTPERPILEVWTAYENQWVAMAQTSTLRFRTIPWPVAVPITAPEMLLPIHIAAFILNPQHSPGKARKDRLREALLHWHPDRFETKWLNKVIEEDREDVKEGVGLVVRALNDLLSAEGTFAA